MLARVVRTGGEVLETLGFSEGNPASAGQVEFGEFENFAGEFAGFLHVVDGVVGDDALGASAGGNEVKCEDELLAEHERGGGQSDVFDANGSACLYADKRERFWVA